MFVCVRVCVRVQWAGRQLSPIFRCQLCLSSLKRFRRRSSRYVYECVIQIHTYIHTYKHAYRQTKIILHVSTCLYILTCTCMSLYICDIHVYNHIYVNTFTQYLYANISLRSFRYAFVFVCVCAFVSIAPDMYTHDHMYAHQV